VARWEIFGKRLFLTGLFGNCWVVPDHLSGRLPPDQDPYDDMPAGAKALRLADLFPDQAPLVPAWWVTLRLVVPTGPRLIYRHFGFESLHEHYRLIYVVQGRVRRVRDMDGREWARRNGLNWPDREWFDSHPLALAWPEQPKLEEAAAEDEELPDWRACEESRRRWLLYEAAQLRELEKPCGQVPS
jgi:hypothetical protein